MKSVAKFRKWARKVSKKKGLICHFYILEKDEQRDKQYYGKKDYVYFNLCSSSRDWIVKGTPHHGITDRHNKPSEIPCLNCYQVNDKFFEALKQLQLEKSKKFEFGIILNKRKLKKIFEVIKVRRWEYGKNSQKPRARKCHHYDDFRFRKSLEPFNYCDVVRLEIPKQIFLKVPVTRIPYKALMGFFVTRGHKQAIRKLLKEKKMEQVKIFPLL